MITGRDNYPENFRSSYTDIWIVWDAKKGGWWCLIEIVICPGTKSCPGKRLKKMRPGLWWWDVRKKCESSKVVNYHRLKAGGFGLRLKAGFCRPLADLYDFEIVIWFLWLLRFNILLPHFICYISATRHPVTPRPQMLSPISFS